MDVVRVDNTITFEAFLEQYFQPEIPVILTNVTQDWPKTKMWNDKDLLNELLQAEVAVNKLWFQTHTDFLETISKTPAIVAKLLTPRYCFVRKNNKRIWIHYKNNLTPFHADANGLFVFNVQVTGSKHWQLIDPNAPIKLYSFTQFPHLHYNLNIPAAFQKYVYEFDLHTGEMLFLPPYWYHKVRALEPSNINVNWVGTKKISKDSRLHHREKEIMKCLLPLSQIKWCNQLIDLMVGSKEPNYLANYGGNAGKKHLYAITEQISYGAGLKRLLGEIIKMPLLLKDFNKIAQYENNPVDTIKKHLQ